jgi:hypothetical protein
MCVLSPLIAKISGEPAFKALEKISFLLNPLIMEVL